MQSDNANVTGITIGGRAVAMGSVTPNYSDADFASAPDIGFILGESMDEDVAVSFTRGNNNSTLAWAYLSNANAGDDPTATLSTTTPGEIPLIDDLSVLYVKNVSQDGSKTYWYRVLIDVRSDNAKSSDILLNGVNLDEGNGANVINVGTETNLRGAATLTTAKAAAPVVATVHLHDVDADVTGYVVTSGTTPAVGDLLTTGITQVGATTEWTIADVGALTTGQHLFVQVTAHDPSTSWYYRIVVTVQSNIADLASITIGGITAGSIGTADAVIANVVKGEISIPGTVLDNDVAVAIGKTQSDAVVTMVKTASAAEPADADFVEIADISGLVNTDVVWFKVVSQDGDVTKYYAVVVSGI